MNNNDATSDDQERPGERAPWRTARLRCEFLENSIGIDETRPRLSWILEADRRGARQSAWQIIASTTLELLDLGRGDLWDSGKVQSNRSVHVHYSGRALRSGERCHWKVRAWDQEDRASAFSAPAFFEIGLLDGFDASACWIGHAPEQADATRHPVEKARWIWAAEREAGKSDGTLFFRRKFEISGIGSVQSARLSIGAGGFYDIWINGAWIDPPGEENRRWRGFHTVNIRPYLEEGRNLINLSVDRASAPEGPGLLAAAEIASSRSWTMVVATDRNWRISSTKSSKKPSRNSAKEQEDWSRPAYDDGRWEEPVEIAAYGESALDRLADIAKPLPCPHLRRTFTIDKPVVRARLHATALGLYEMRLNGTRVGDHCFSPGWTDYGKRIQYQTHDVTGLIAEGTNALGAILGDGWYAGAVGFFARRHHYGPYPLGLLAQLLIDFEDGTSEMVVTDPSWTASGGPILSSDFLAGEFYDARRAMPGWDRAGFDDGAWQAVTILDGPGAAIVAQRSPPVRRTMEVAPRSVSRPERGVSLFDLGQNMVGCVRLSVQGEAGDRVVVRFAEALDEKGRLYTDNLRGAACTDTFVLAGDGTETFEPRFTYHGFRYVEVAGLRSELALDALTGVVIHSDLDRSGSFTCSNEMVNRLQSNIVWSQWGNFVDVPTDCPQRDERLGWLGDAQIFAPTACFNMDTAAFFTKWMDDVIDAQSSEGAFPDVAPRLVAETDGSPAWGDAGVIVPWTCHLFYEDRGLVERNLEAMEKWIAYIAEANPRLIWRKRTGNNYGDWVSIDAETPKDLLATAYFAHSTRLVSRMARAIGNEAAAERHGALFAEICAAFCGRFVDGDARIEGETQTAYALALAFDLLPEDLRARAANRLVDRIEARGWRLSTGFVGVGHILPVLTRFGHADTAYRLLMSEDYPSWGHCIRHGATTIWERWDGFTEEKGFQDPRMNSFNHYALGSVGAWLFGSVSGIATDPERPGFERILIEPRPGGGLTHARATYESIRGTIECRWRLADGRLAIDVRIPANTTARVRIPARTDARITESGMPIEDATGIRLVSRDDDAAHLDVESGAYAFEV